MDAVLIKWGNLDSETGRGGGGLGLGLCFPNGRALPGRAGSPLF